MLRGVDVGPDRWVAVDALVEQLLVPADPVLEDALAAADAAGLPPHQVSAPQGRLLELLARMAGARSVLEVGTLAGYSTIWLARALPPDGRLVTLELEPRHADVARANLARAGLDGLVEVRLGRSGDSLAALAAEGQGPFDLIFLDGDKGRADDHLDLALGLARPGTVIVADNVVRGGAVADRSSPDPGAQGVRRLHERLAREPRIQATTIQTVGAKGYDGFTLAIVGDADADGDR